MAATIVLVVAGAASPEPTVAAIGDLLSTLNLKQADGITDLCPPVNINGIGNGTTGTSVAIVQASKLGFFRPTYQPKVLLVTSCLGASSDAVRKKTIYFVNPTTGRAVTSIVTSFEPPRGWSAISLRPDKGDFIACVATGSNTGNLEIYKISYQGTAAALVTSGNGALKGPYCDGLAWDYDTKTIYASKDGGTTIRRWISASNNDIFTQVSPDLGASPALPASCLNSGLALVDGALFVACQGVSSGTLSNAGHLLNKTTPGAALSSLPLFAQTLVDDIECDAVTFGEVVPYRDALWAKNRTTNVLNAFQLPAFTCGRSLGPADPATTLAPPSFKGPGACPVWYLGNPNDDTDGDGLLDCWEDASVWTTGGGCTGPTCNGKPGIDWDGDGTRDIDLCVGSVCVNKLRKDILVEVDSMDNHPFMSEARQDVIDAFNNAPVPNPSVADSSGTPGIQLLALTDDGNGGLPGVPHTNFVALEPCTPPAGPADANLDQLKKSFFGTSAERALAEPQKSKTLFAKRMAFRWALFAHDLKPPALSPGAKSSGCSKIGGDDFVVTLGSIFAGTVQSGSPEVNGNRNDQAGTFMHELGHALGLRHGGPDNDNCKPNYLSVMSYSRQFSDGVPLSARRLDYSRSVMPTLDETKLNETLGIGTPALPLGVTDEIVFTADGTFLEPATTLTPGATSGKSVTFTIGAIPTFGFAATDIGKILRGDGVAGEATIRVVLSPTTVKADITEPFASTSAISPGSWRLVSRVQVIMPVPGSLDWNNDSVINVVDPILGPFVVNDVNNFAFPDSEVSGCDVSKGDQLVGWDDWATLQYNHRASVDVAAGGSNEVQDSANALGLLFENVDVNADGRPDGRCLNTGQLWVIDIQSPINLDQPPGGVQVKFFSQPGCIVANLDPSTLTLAGSGGKFGVRTKPDGSFNCNSPDLNKDGLRDFVCHFNDDGFVAGDVVGVVEGYTFPDPANPQFPTFGLRARAPVIVQ